MPVYASSVPQFCQTPSEEQCHGTERCWLSAVPNSPSLCGLQLLKTAHQFMQVISRAIQNEVPVRIPMQQTDPKEKHNFSSDALCKSLPGQNSAGVKN